MTTAAADKAKGELDPAIVKIVEALARSAARRDYARLAGKQTGYHETSRDLRALLVRSPARQID
ncbi:hypothetical protein KQX64_06815 [Rhodopseudomonas palustris]|nr:hypothetical protein KQX64_06815 [Rhodopseudomonas palustris]